MQNLNNVACYIAYGAGFGMDTFLGILIEKKVAVARSIIRIITRKDATDLINHLTSEGYGVTYLDAQGSKGLVHVIYMDIRRHDLEKIVEIIHRFNLKAFFTVEDVNLVSEGIFPMRKHRLYVAPLFESSSTIYVFIIICRWVFSYANLVFQISHVLMI